MDKPRLIFVPQLPTFMRYTDWWIEEFYNNLKKSFSDIIVLGHKHASKYYSYKTDNEEIFFNMDNSLKFENAQIEEYINLDLKDDDVLLLADISFPGLFSSILYHKKPKKCFAICHGTSKNNFDIFEKDRSSKWQVESGNAELFDAIFVGSEYHKHKLGWLGVKVIGMPHPPMKYNCDVDKEKTIDILSVSRKTFQKVDDNIESVVEEEFGKIVRKKMNSWNEYFDTLSSAKILLITAREETYGYQIIDCLKYGNGCVPFAPNQFSYPELLNKDHLYNRNDIKSLIEKIRNVLNGDFKNRNFGDYDERILSDRGISFYDILVEEMFK